MHGTKLESQKGSSSWLDLCNNGDYNIPPTGLEFHNKQLMSNSGHQQPNVAPISPHGSREQDTVNKPRQKEMFNCSNNPSSSIGSIPQSGIGFQASKAHKRPTYSGNVSNSSTHYYTGPHYSQLATAASSNFNRNSSRYTYYQQHHT